ncbi:hypothetical protein [Enterobacter sp. NFIX58]|uniref:hypothetical protein n=1 Tax=Enterobacter sp. NFIX58 TaxID=1566251 RepID=UPI000B8655C9|nr:hypothetical protein [Enterobacter sp. NFIX58]
MSNKKIHPVIDAVAFEDYARNALVVQDDCVDGVRHEFDGRQWAEISKSARQDLLMRVDNFERSPTPPLPVTDAIAIHVKERNAVVVKGLACQPDEYDFSYQQWDVICRVSSNELYRRLSEHYIRRAWLQKHIQE